MFLLSLLLLRLALQLQLPFQVLGLLLGRFAPQCLQQLVLRCAFTLSIVPLRLEPHELLLLFVLRLVVASAMAGCLVVGVAAARRRDFATHRAWMIRAYALAVAAGTQVFTQGFGEAVVGHGELRGDLLKAAGWVINLAVAEWAIRRPTRRRTSRSLVVEGASA